MLFRIREKAPLQTETPATPDALLLACHGRIRGFCALSSRLATAEGETPDRVADAAAAIRRYFDLALPLHEEDEEVSIAPRLQAAQDVAMNEALDRMAAEHVALHAILRELDPIWARLAAGGAELAAVASALDEGSRRLEAAFEAHLAAEEAVVIPRVASLPSEERSAIADEMRARRTPRA